MQVVDHFNELFVACLNDMHIYYTQRGLYTFAHIIFKIHLLFQCDGSSGACWEYDSWSLASDVFIESFVLKSMSSISFFLAWYNYHPASAEEDAPESEVQAKGTEQLPVEMQALDENDMLETGESDS